MRWRSVSKRARSKNRRFPHGIFELTRVARAPFSRDSSTASTPLNVRDRTTTVPFSLQAMAKRATAATHKTRGVRTAGTSITQLVPLQLMGRERQEGREGQEGRTLSGS